MKWNEVTWYSRLCAIILFFGVIPVLAFYLGTEFEKVKNYSYQTVPVVSTLKTTPQEKPENRAWESYINPTHHFSFIFPAEPKYLVYEHGEEDTKNGAYGNYILRTRPNAYAETIFSIEVLNTPEWSTIGNANGDLDTLMNSYTEGGIKSVAELSRQVNLKEEKYAPNKKVSEIAEFKFANGIGYGFMLSDTFRVCFNTNILCESGSPIDGLHAVVFVERDEVLYRITFVSDAVGTEIFNSLTI